MEDKLKKRDYDSPKAELIKFDSLDVIATSDPKFGSDVEDSGWTS